MSQFNRGDPSAVRGAPAGAAGATAAGRRRRSRRIWLSVTLAAILAASLSGATAWLARASNDQVISWAPRPREIAGLRAVATSHASGYSLYTAHGVVRFLPGVDLDE